MKARTCRCADWSSSCWESSRPGWRRFQLGGGDTTHVDNLGYLDRAPSPEVRQRIIDGRIRHLENEIRAFQDQIDKLLGGG